MTTTSSTKPEPFGRRIIAGIVFLYLLMRLALIWKAPSIFCVPQELYQGYIAFDWIHGLKTSLLNYQVDPYTAGSIVVGTLAAPFFYLLGPNLFALKCVPLLFSAGALTWILFTLRDYFNRQTVIAAGMLAVFAPPGFTFLSAIALGSHPESVFFAGMITFYFLRTVAKPFQNLNLILWGLASGAGFWFAHINIAPLITALLLCVFLKPSGDNVRRGLIWSIAFLAGFWPWLLYNSTHHWQGVQFLSDALRPSSLAPWLLIKTTGGEFLRTLFLYFPESFFYRSQAGIDLTVFELIYLGLILILYCFFALEFFRRLKTGKLPANKQSFPFIFFLLFPLIFLMFFAYARGEFPWHARWNPYRFRYLTPLFTFSIIPAAIAAGFFKRGRILWIAIVGMGILGQIQAFTFPSKARSTDLTGYYLEHPKRIFDFFPKGLPNSPAKLSAYLEALPPEELQERMGQLMYHDGFWTMDLQPELRNKIAERLNPKLQRAFYIEWGRANGMFVDAPWNTEITVPAFIPSFFADNYIYGLSKSFSWREAPSLRRILDFISKQPADYQPFYLLTAGTRVFTWTTLTGTPKRISPGTWARIGEMDPVSRAWLMRGVGRGLLWTVGNPKHLEIALKNFEGLLTNQDKDNILWGMGWQMQRLEVSRDVLSVFSKEDTEKILLGFKANQRWEEDPEAKIGDLYGG